VLGPILNVPLRTLVGFERAEAIVFFGNQDPGDYLFFAETSEWLRTERETVLAWTPATFKWIYLAWAKLFHLCLPIRDHTTNKNQKMSGKSDKKNIKYGHQQYLVELRKS
jgi:hypothetical protein